MADGRPSPRARARRWRRSTGWGLAAAAVALVSGLLVAGGLDGLTGGRVLFALLLGVAVGLAHASLLAQAQAAGRPAGARRSRTGGRPR